MVLDKIFRNIYKKSLVKYSLISRNSPFKIHKKKSLKYLLKSPQRVLWFLKNSFAEQKALESSDIILENPLKKSNSPQKNILKNSRRVLEKIHIWPLRNHYFKILEWSLK